MRREKCKEECKYNVAFLLTLGCASTVPIEPRLTLAEEWTSYHKTDHNGPGTYAFGYDIEDPKTGNIQFRQEEKYSNGTVAGSYGFVDPDGNVKITHYVADEDGYRAVVENSGGRAVRYPPDDIVYNLNPIDSPSPQMESALRSLRINKASWEEQRTPPKYQTPSYSFGFSNILR